MSSPPSFDESSLLELIQERLGRQPSDRLILGIGDDAAMLQLDGEHVVTTDLLAESIHFLPDTPPALIGKKAINVNVSDLAAMAAEPVAATLALAIPAGWNRQRCHELIGGIAAACDAARMPVVGGDISRSRQGLHLSVTAIGRITGRGAVRRSGARPGDAICVTGPLGYSYLGRHLNFEPRWREALWLHEHGQLTAMMDLSDGLAADLPRLCHQSGCGALLWEDCIPVASAPDDRQDHRSALDHALHDGEDFELLFCCEPNDTHWRAAPIELGLTVTQIGTIEAARELRIVRDGQSRPLPTGGYTHQW